MKNKTLLIISILLGIGVIAMAVVATKTNKPNDPPSPIATENLFMSVKSTHNPFDLQAIEVEAAKERAKTDTTVNTNYIFVTAVTAISGGVINDMVTQKVTALARGVCWDTSPDPTIDDSYTINGSGNGSFYSVITGLSPNTPYYVRSYGKYIWNESQNVFYSYGPEVTFTTTNWMPPFTCIHKTIEKLTPDVIEMIYNYNDLNNKGFKVDGFQVKVNDINVKIKSMKIVNNVMYLTINKSVGPSDVVMIKYIKEPSSDEETNPFIGWTEVFNNIL